MKRKIIEEEKQETKVEIDEVNSPEINEIGPSSSKKKKYMLMCKGCFTPYEDLKQCNTELCDELYCKGCYEAFAIKRLHICASCDDMCCNMHIIRCKSLINDNNCLFGICRKCDKDEKFKTCNSCESKYCSLCLKDCKVPNCKNNICYECSIECETCGIYLCKEKEEHVCSQEITNYLTSQLDVEKRKMIYDLYEKNFNSKKKNNSGVDSNDQSTEEENDEDSINPEDKLIEQINLLLDDSLSDLIIQANGNKEIFINKVKNALISKYKEQ